MTLNSFLFQALNGLSAASALFLVSVGLSLIFGVTRIINIAHGSLYMVGTYLAYSFATKIGVNLETGNFHSDDVYAEMERVAPDALNVQVKVVTSGPEKKKVPTDYARLAKILRGANYRGYIALEYEEAGDPREECPRALKELREAFA